MRKYETIKVNDFLLAEIVVTVKEEDYLKVVGEKELYKNKFETVMYDDSYLKKIEKLEKELEELKYKENDIIDQMSELTNFICVGNKHNKGKVGMRTSDAVIEIIKEKDEEIKRLEVENDNLRNDLSFKNNRIKGLEERINCLELGIKEEEEELWCLEYIYCDCNGFKKIVNIGPQPLEEIHELVGMDCDNWVSWKIEKEVK